MLSQPDERDSVRNEQDDGPYSVSGSPSLACHVVFCQCLTAVHTRTHARTRSQNTHALKQTHTEGRVRRQRERERERERERAVGH